MSSLDFHHIHKPCRASCKHSSRKSKCRNRVISALIQRTSSILNASSVLKILLNLWMRLEFLKFLVRIQVRILIVKSYHKPNMNLVLIHMVHKAAPIRFCIKRPVDCMHDQSILKQRIFNLPDLLESKSIRLGDQNILIQVIFLHDLLRVRSSTPFREDRLCSLNYRPSLKCILP